MRSGINPKGDSDSLRESEYNNSNVVSPRKSVSQKFNNNIEPSTGNFPDSNLGIIGTMKVNTPKSTNKSDIVLVQEIALVRQVQLTGIYTIGSGNVAILRWLRIGKTFGNQVEILSGLSADEQYIVSAEGKLFNGAKISVQ
jgi:hypothetical protein